MHVAGIRRAHHARGPKYQLGGALAAAGRVCAGGVCGEGGGDGELLSSRVRDEVRGKKETQGILERGKLGDNASGGVEITLGYRTLTADFCSYRTRSYSSWRIVGCGISRE